MSDLEPVNVLGFVEWLDHLPPTTVAAIDVAPFTGTYLATSGRTLPVFGEREWCDEADLAAGEYADGSLWRCWSPAAVKWAFDHREDAEIGESPHAPLAFGTLPELPPDPLAA